ncbi:MAG TPA: glycoside hydrolase family 57 protein [Gammaproteobacteria bacterium]
MPAESRPPLKVVLCWHMHQPHYLDHESGRYQLPWTYLHAIKDYVDMAAFIEANPAARAVVNFVPTLLEQIDDYATQVRGYLEDSRPIGDTLLAALVSPALPSDEEHRLWLIKACLRANEQRLIERFPAYRDLVSLARCVCEFPHTIGYISGQYLADLLVWYHLAWIGETVRRSDDRVQQLMSKGSGYTQHDRRQLLTIIGELMAGVIGRYRRLADHGQIELSLTPYAHPIAPLLLDIDSARDAMPEVTLPAHPRYPGGEESLRWHIDEGLRVFEHYFGRRPQGIWPAEGAVSAATLKVFAESGFRWSASGESVLRHSFTRAHLAPPSCLHHPYRLDPSTLTLFFRDDGLSDLIGFTYADWQADDAVNNLLHHLENIAKACKDDPHRVVSIIMDGENAWEYYPENGYYFLTTLYRRLGAHPAFTLTTFNELLDSGIEAQVLPTLVAGSWVYGSFSTWIGAGDKNRAWDLLCAAKLAFDAAVSNGQLSGERLLRARRQLAVCEGSDWFWWFGDYNPAESVRDFDRLYRLQLAQLYKMIGTDVPETLSQVISHGGGAPEAGGVMRRGSEDL